jgi:PmbA protein
MGFYMAVGTCNYNKLSPETVGKKAALKALETLGATPVPSGKYKVVLENDCAGSLLNVFFDAFSADASHKGFSLLKGKLGEKVAADCVTIIDDPLIPWAMGSQPFDSEGVACYSKTVVENGVLKTFLHNLKTARKDGVKPTGNGYKGGYNAPLGIGPTNFFIKPCEQSPEELFAKAGDGLIITDFQGLHAGANPVSGEFSLQAQGFVIKDGKKDRPVELITVSGNFFRLLENIIAVADDLDFENPRGISTIVSPSILVDSLDIAGS